MPTTPWCHSLAGQHQRAALLRRAGRSIWSTAPGRRWPAPPPGAPGSGRTAAWPAPPPRRDRCLSSRSAARSAAPMRPAALIRGASTKPIWIGGDGACPAALPPSAGRGCPQNPCGAGRPSPQETMVRFSPVHPHDVGHGADGGQSAVPGEQGVLPAPSAQGQHQLQRHAARRPDA